MGRVSRRPEGVAEKDKVLSDQGRRPKSENCFATFATPFVRREKSRTTRGPWCLDPPMLGDPKMRPTELRMTPAAPLDEDSRATRSRSHTRTSVRQHSLPTVMRSARTVSQVASKCCTRTSTVKRRACASRVCVCQRASACDHSQTAVQTQSTLLKNGLDQTPCANVCAQIRVTERAVNTAG